jgi:hypothetical protein
MVSEAKPEYWFMSFAEETGKNLGCCIIASESAQQAHALSHRYGINPGGQMQSSGLTKEQFKLQGLELNKLYTREEMMKMGFQL